MHCRHAAIAFTTQVLPLDITVSPSLCMQPVYCLQQKLSVKLILRSYPFLHNCVWASQMNHTLMRAISVMQAVLSEWSRLAIHSML